MKRILAAALACLMLCACASDPVTPTVTDPTEEGRVPNRVPVTEAPTTPGTDPTDPAAPTDPAQTDPPATQQPTEPAPTEPPAPTYEVLQRFEPGITQDSGRISWDSPALNIDTAGRGLLGITVKNTSGASKLTVYYTTSGDGTYNSPKSINVDINPYSAKSALYIVDLSECYGWTTGLTGIRVVSSAIYGGEMALEKVEIYDAGTLVPNFTLTEETLIATRDEMKEGTADGRSFYPDGIMSALKNSDGSYTFFSSNPLSGTATLTAYKGTLADPVQELLFEGREVLGSPVGFGINEFNYISVGQIYRFEGSECLTILHLEQHFDHNEGFDENGTRTNESNTYMRASLALGYSPDDGNTWYFCGEILTHSCETNGQYFGFGSLDPNNVIGWPTRDIGNAPFVIKDGYLYIYAIDFNENYAMGLSVARAKLTDVIAAARGKDAGKKTDLFKKFYNGSFSEPGFAGKFTNVIDAECPANFMAIIYSEHLKKYVMVRCSSPAYATNDGDIVMNLSDDLTNFRGNNYYIDADPMGSQYPTILATSGDDPTFTGGKEFYIYYISAVTDERFLWDKADIVRRTVTFY